MHDRAIVIRHTITNGTVYAAELASVETKVLPEDVDVLVPVKSHLFVPQSQSMAYLVDWDAKLQAT